MRSEETVRSQSSAYNSSTIRIQLIHEEVNSIMNYANVMKMYKDGRGRDIGDELKKNKDPCIILGSGPSLDYSIQFLKDWKGGIICTTSHARTLMYYGIEPTYILVLDPFCCWEEIEGIDWSQTKTKLISTPCCHPSLFEKWPNDVLFYIQNTGDDNSFYSTTLKRMYSRRDDEHKRDCTFTYYIRTEIVLFACSPPMQIFVAQILNYGNIFLCGVDFGFSKEKERFTEWTRKDIDSGSYSNNGYKENKSNGLNKEEWEKHEHPYIPNENDIVCKNGVLTQDIHLYYKKNFISSWRLSHQTIYTTDHGIISEIPFVDIEELIKNEGSMEEQSFEFINDIADSYLASVGCFVIETETAGVSFVESNNPIPELTEYMRGINNGYICKHCKSKFKYVPDGKPVETKCINCGKEDALIQVCRIDIDKNINRVKKLLEPLKKKERNKKKNEKKKLMRK